MTLKNPNLLSNVANVLLKKKNVESTQALNTRISLHKSNIKLSENCFKM